MDSTECEPDVQVIYENEDILVINKPAGVSSQEDLTNTVSVLQIFSKMHVLTRLDKRVSGLMVLAKCSIAAQKYSYLLQNNKLHKKYHCVVKNQPPKDSDTLVHWLLKGPKTKAYTEEKRGAKKSVLQYKVIQSSERYHLVEIIIETGRFHQIRAQMAAIDCPIVGDLKYGFKRNSSDGSIFLCCTHVEIEIEENSIKVEIPFPEVWSMYGLKSLKNE